MGLMMVERGLSTLQLGLAFAALGVVSSAFLLVGGVVGDRIPVRFAIFAFSWATPA